MLSPHREFDRSLLTGFTLLKLQVVMARRTTLEMGQTVDPLVILECLQERDPSAYQFLIQLPSGQAFFGSTVSSYRALLRGGPQSALKSSPDQEAFLESVVKIQNKCRKRDLDMERCSCWSVFKLQRDERTSRTPLLPTKTISPVISLPRAQDIYPYIAT
jgi:hypothetical protein